MIYPLYLRSPVIPMPLFLVAPIRHRYGLPLPLHPIRFAPGPALRQVLGDSMSYPMMGMTLIGCMGIGNGMTHDMHLHWEFMWMLKYVEIKKTWKSQGI